MKVPLHDRAEEGYKLFTIPTGKSAARASLARHNMAKAPIRRGDFVGKWGTGRRHGAKWLTEMQNRLLAKSNCLELGIFPSPP